MRMWYVYILECANKSLYTGITNDIARRLREHKQKKGAKFTKAFGVSQIVHKEKYPTRSSALKREALIKSLTRKEKIALIKSAT